MIINMNKPIENLIEQTALMIFHAENEQRLPDYRILAKQILSQEGLSYVYYEDEDVECGACHGSGESIHGLHKCMFCDGKGYTVESCQQVIPLKDLINEE